MENRRIAAWYDEENDTLHIRWKDGVGYYSPTSDDRVLERVSEDGVESLGFMIEDVHSLKRNDKAEFEIGVGATGDVQNLSVEMAAERLGVTPRYIRRLCKEGRVRGAKRLGHSWVIPTPLDIAEGSRGRPGVAATVHALNEPRKRYDARDRG
jgi:excisionase family DNA binding protein